MVVRGDSGGVAEAPRVGARVSTPIRGTVPTPNPWNAAYPDTQSTGRAHSHVVFGKVNRFRFFGAGHLSVKTVFSGYALVETGGGLHRIDPGTYLIVNQGRDYEIRFNSDRPVDGLSMFFEPRMAGQAIQVFRQSAERQLDDPFRLPSPDIQFFERMFASDGVQEHLERVHDELPAFHGDPMWVQESLHLTLSLMLERHVEVWEEVDRVQAVRTVTKEELYRRLHKARDFAYATLDQPVSLDDLAYVACLSTNYFLRSFRGLFRQTPHQFIIEKRMERARSLLSETGLSVSEVCVAVGFQSLGSFSWLFKKRVGASPEAYRRATRAA